jgi:iron complex outermembrane receptor protein
MRDELEGDTGVWGADMPGQRRETDHFSPQIGVIYQPFVGVKLKSNLARYVREPAFYERFGDRGFLIGNSDLSAEKGINFDIGAEIDWQWDGAWVQNLSASVAYFRTDADDLITQVYDARGIGRSVNISEARIQGVESRLSLDFLDHFRLAINATWQDPENRSGIEAFDGKNLPGRFETAWRARLEARWRGWKAHLEYLREDGMFYDAANLLPAEDKKEINAGISWLLDGWAGPESSLLIALEGRNLGDDLYEDFNGYPQPGRSWFCSVKLAF